MGSLNAKYEAGHPPIVETHGRNVVGYIGCRVSEVLKSPHQEQLIRQWNDRLQIAAVLTRRLRTVRGSINTLAAQFDV